MNKKTWWYCLILVIFSIFLTFTVQAQKCGTMDYRSIIIQQYPSSLSKINALEEIISNNGYFLQQTDEPIIIPVVVHVVYNTTEQNISENQINSQIQILNNDYRKLNSDISNVPPLFENDASDCSIEFVLATYDPNGNQTTGITRTETSIQEFFYDDDYVKMTSEGGIDSWDSQRYLNLWVCNLESGILGYSSFPGVGPASLDGVVIDYKAFGNTGTAEAPNNKGRTATHEIGHWLNLYHIWGDDREYPNDPLNDCEGDDLVYDTPNQDTMNWNCPSFPDPSCD